MSQFFDCVVVTSSNSNQCELFKKELVLCKKKSLGLSPTCEILALSDPLSIRVGSGGATFYAMSQAYRPGKSLLILHSGGDSRRNPLCCVSGKGFAAMNFAEEETASNPIERLLTQLEEFMPIKSGVFICATDTLMTKLEGPFNETCFQPHTVTGVGMYAPWEFGTRHGVFYPIRASQFGLLQKATEVTLRSTSNCIQDEQVLLDSGIVHLGHQVSDSIAVLLQQSPKFAGFTNEGMDQGVLPFSFDLYTDFLGALGESASESDLFSGFFSSFPFRVFTCSRTCEFIHLGTTREHQEFVSRAKRHWKSHLDPQGEGEGFVLINSLVRTGHGGTIQPGAVLEHCDLGGMFSIGQNCVCSQLSFPNGGFKLENDMAMQSVLLQNDTYCFVLFGLFDGIKEVGGTFCNRLDWDPIVTAHCWKEEETEKTLWTARLFPVRRIADTSSSLEPSLWMMRKDLDSVSFAVKAAWQHAERLSLRDLVWNANVEAQFTRNKIALPSMIFAHRVCQSILHSLPTPRFQNYLDVYVVLAQLDQFLVHGTKDDRQVARGLSIMAELICPGRRGSGIAQNPAFALALRDLSKSTPQSSLRLNALMALATLRNDVYWKDHAERMACHYEYASQVVMGRCLHQDKLAFSPVVVGGLPTHDEWFHATAPARIDLAGGWSDTPPITFEVGGFVVNLAVNLSPHEHALSASARRLPITEFVLAIENSNQEKDVSTTTTRCTQMKDITEALGNPRASHALLKCVLLALFDVEELFALPFGLEVRIHSRLPPGSGLGGSSILAACALMVVSKCCGILVDKHQLVQLVLRVEQLLSTGGGWQDQIGSIYPGFKFSSSPAQLPVTVQVKVLNPPKGVVEWFESRGVLVQTGPARLAKDLLQVVIRRWHSRVVEFVRAMQELQENAHAMKHALEAGNTHDVILQVNRYWELKKYVTGSAQAEPLEVQSLFETVQDLVDAHMLCGAGGGGFAFLLLKPGVDFSACQLRISTRFPTMKVFPVSLCDRGLTTSWSS